MSTKALAGKWQMYKAERFEEFLEEMGANWLIRKAANTVHPLVEIVIDGDHIQIFTTTLMWKQEDDLHIGVTHTKKMPQGNVTMQMTPTWDGDTLVIDMVPVEKDRGKPHKIKRHVEGDEMITTLITEKNECKRYFKRIVK